jgi:glutamyl-tRNA reductase
MVVGESQILGQVRDALRRGQGAETVAAALNTLFQQGLRVGKRAHSETDIDRAGQSIVSVALEDAAAVIGPIEGARVCIVGAGSVAALAAASVHRLGAADIVVSSRTPGNAARLAERVGGRQVALEDLGAAITEADLVISCTAATGAVISAGTVAAALTARRAETPLAVVDLALPHDVAPEVGELPGVSLIALKSLAQSVHNGSAHADVAAVKAIVAEGSRPTPRPARRPASLRPWLPCAPWPRRWSVPSSIACSAAWTTSPTNSVPRSPRPSAGWPTSCCTSRRCGSRNSPAERRTRRMPKRSPNCSRWTRQRSRL